MHTAPRLARACSPLRVVVVAVVIAGVGVACSDAEAPQGSTAEGEGEGEGEVVVGEGEGEGAAVTDCTTTPCPTDQQCGSLFSGGLAPACYATCSDGNAPCTTTAGSTGECRNFTDFEHPICRAQAGLLQRCGNDVNAGCLDEPALCVTFPQRALFPDGGGICAVGCAVDGDCADAALGCSHDLTFTSGGSTTAQGLCAPISSTGAVCGRVNDVVVLCTGATHCDRQPTNEQGHCIAN